MIIYSTATAHTLAIGRKIGAGLEPGQAVSLNGPLGAGKTWLAKGIAHGLGVPEHEYVNSPAFDLVHEYQGRVPVYHMDFYRLDHLAAEDMAWIEEYLSGRGVCVIEWAEKFKADLGINGLTIQIDYLPHPDHRRLRIFSPGQEDASWMRRFKDLS